MLSRQPYGGSSRKLVLAFDVGTTYSGVSYSILDPGEVPKIHGVARYPAQEQIGGDHKIPSILYYDKQGVVRAVGAETLQQHIVEQADEEGWVKLEWWKLHLRAKHLASSHIKDDDIPPLPQGKDAVQVLGDFMQYLFKCACDYIMEAHGPNMWRSLESHIEFVLTHPNGWEGPQQQQIRRAAELAGLIPGDGEGQSRIHLLTEGEASLHYCVANVLASDSFFKMPIICTDGPDEEDYEEPGPQGIVIIDAGGGTIDLSAYSVKLSPPTYFEEVAPAECRLQGSVFVTQRAHAFLKAKLANSRYGTPDILKQMKEIFDKETKLRFRNADEPQYIKFGTVRDKDLQYDIRSGQLKMTGGDVAKLFEPSIQEIAEAFEQQRRATTLPIKHAFLVGGYAASDFLYASLQKHPTFVTTNVCRPGNHVNKVVADGAVLFHIDHLVKSRAARFAYGIECNALYMRNDPEHLARRGTVFRDRSGTARIPNAFKPILTKGTKVEERTEFRESFFTERIPACVMDYAETEILAYRGSLINPKWTDKEPNLFAKLCTIRADPSELVKTLTPRQSLDGEQYYCIYLDVILLFGLTELKAQLSWKENGVEKRSPASIVYDD